MDYIPSTIIFGGSRPKVASGTRKCQLKSTPNAVRAGYTKGTKNVKMKLSVCQLLFSLKRSPEPFIHSLKYCS